MIFLSYSFLNAVVKQRDVKVLAFAVFSCSFLHNSHAKFRIVCSDTDVLNTALVAIHNARCNYIV